VPRSRSSRPPIDDPDVRVLFVAGFGPIVADGPASRALYVDALRIPFEAGPDGYLHTERLDGVRAFALWPLSGAASSCFGSETWPDDLPAPTAWLEFDVEDLPRATAALERRGYRLLVRNRREPWGQSVTRFLSPEGILVGVTHTPWMREPKRPARRQAGSARRPATRRQSSSA